MGAKRAEVSLPGGFTTGRVMCPDFPAALALELFPEATQEATGLSMDIAGSIWGEGDFKERATPYSACGVLMKATCK